MAYIDNQSKMMLAVLNDEQLMKFGEYSPADIPDNIYSALDSDNYIINAVATIIYRKSLGATDRDIYNQINQYLQTKL